MKNKIFKYNQKLFMEIRFKKILIRLVSVIQK